MNSILVRIATTTVAALTIVFAAASPVQAAGLGNCNDSGASTPCFEKVWSEGRQIKMTFVDVNPAPSNAPTQKFYVMAPETRTPQGWVPFLHDHTIGDVSAQNHRDYLGNNPVRYHAYFVLCSALGISTGRCVPAITSIPGLGTIPFAARVNGHKLTSAGAIESPANSRFLALADTGGEIIATTNRLQEDQSR
ncbi:MAG TPA: hypothetical protein VGD57_06565 [Candidatus Dormibacteraeota bacterium]